MVLIFVFLSIFLLFSIATACACYKVYAGCKRVIDKRKEFEMKTILILQHRTSVIVEKSQLLENRLNQCIYLVELTELRAERNSMIAQSMNIPMQD